jgi:carotenoid cleavage dioxygenase
MSQAEHSNDTISVQENPFLQGNFAPVEQELTASELKVEGTIPTELKGTLLRDGPNPIEPGPDHHWFQGNGMLHAISLADGAATGYRNRYIRTERIEQALGYRAVDKNPNQPAVQGSGSVNVIGHAGRILALGEVGLPFEVDTDLNTLRLYDFNDGLKTNMTAHPKIDGKNGELVFFGYDFGAVSLRYHLADADGRLIRTVEINKPVPTMMHDFGVTASRAIFMDLPVAFDLEMAMRGAALPFRWRDDIPARLGILPRTAEKDETQWIEIEPCFVYHPLNAYDEGEQIVMDVVRHERTFVEGRLQGGGKSRLERWIIDPAKERVEQEILHDAEQEFPRVDPRVECHRHSIGYGVAFNINGGGPGNLLKHDLEARTATVHDVGAGGAASEGVFVPVGPGEDEGYVLSVIYDATTASSHLRIIDAQDFTAQPVARIMLPQRVPFGFHGNWIAER